MAPLLFEKQNNATGRFLNPGRLVIGAAGACSPSASKIAGIRQLLPRHRAAIFRQMAELCKANISPFQAG